MKRYIYFSIFIPLFFCSCISKQKLMRQELSAVLSQKLGFPVSPKDDLALYEEAVKWLGVPYKSGGNSLTGTDCSGLVCQIYKVVYGIDLPRTVEGIYKECYKTSYYRLKPGDFIFFNTRKAKRKRNANHVGIILKENIFIHASSSKGVMLNRVDEKYYKEHVIRGGKVKKR